LIICRRDGDVELTKEEEDMVEHTRLILKHGYGEIHVVIRKGEISEKKVIFSVHKENRQENLFNRF